MRNISSILQLLHFPSSSGRQYKSRHIVFQFATVRHFLCGAYLTSRFKRGNHSFRFGVTLPPPMLRFPVDSLDSSLLFLRPRARRRFSIRPFNSIANTWSTIRIEKLIRRILPEFCKDVTSSRVEVRHRTAALHSPRRNSDFRQGTTFCPELRRVVAL